MQQRQRQRQRWLACRSASSMLLISAQRCEVVRVPFLSPRAVEQEWDVIIFFELETRTIDIMQFFERIAKFNCPRTGISFIEDNPFAGLWSS